MRFAWNGLLLSTFLLGVCGGLSASAQEAERTPLASEAGAMQVAPPAGDEQKEQRWQLRRGLPVHTQLLGWAERGGWTLSWVPKISWLVAADIEYKGTFEQVLGEVVEGLFFEGKPIRLVLWEGNRLAEVVPSDVL